MLLDLGVVVVAAAGNYSTSRKFYPAAFAPAPPAGQVPLISVGALNPNGSKAVFSDGGHWITAWASGAVVVSTYPIDINASRTPELRMRAHPANPLPPAAARGERESLDPDDYRAASPLERHVVLGSAAGRAHRPAAARGRGRSGGSALDQPGSQAAAANRAAAALRRLGWPG